MAANRRFEPGPDHARRLDRGRRGVVHLGRQAPVAALAHALARGPGQRAAGQELHHASEERLRAGDVAVGEELGDDRPVEGRRQPARGQDRLDLGGEDELAVGQRVVERLDPESVP